MDVDLCNSKRQRAIIAGENDQKKLASSFWQQWQEHRESLYQCCLKLMNFNATDAEDALSQVMLKAWEKVQKYKETITNIKAWLIQLTRNSCIDIIRKCDRASIAQWDIEWVGIEGDMETASEMETPEGVLAEAEKQEKIREAIATLPERFRETFVLHFYEERSHQEIAGVQGISYSNVCKRLSLARKILQEKLSSYFQREDKEERSSRPSPKRYQKSQPQMKERSTSENVPKEVAEKLPTELKEESRKSENQKLSDTLKEEREQSLSVGRQDPKLKAKIETNDKIEEFKEIDKSERSLQLTKRNLSQPKIKKKNAIAFSFTATIPRVKEGFFLLTWGMGLNHSIIKNKLTGSEKIFVTLRKQNISSRSPPSVE
ncbi:MAG: sigma-70 family RNA polymerase sigma factor [Cyanobacteria bacterium SBLK]|nr:sigma-70 family RNA polymerase sigma factor [Cyanobacteria bacterium SBLK]